MLRKFQAEALAALHASRVHLRLTAPTGAGKGVVLEKLAGAEGERIVLLTPLVALARQQSRRFQALEIPHHLSLALGGAPDPGPERGDRVWILSPEGALGSRKTERILEWKPTCVVIDEAHCLEEWGDSFRPAYAKIVEWIRAIGAERTLWMSATFPIALARRLESELSGKWRTIGSFSLPRHLEMSIERVRFGDRLEKVREEVLAERAPGVLFASTRKSAESYARLFRSSGVLLLPYHAGLSDEERRAIESLLEQRRISGTDGLRSPSVSATSAFGMGMDFPQFEWALVSQSPPSLLSLMQAIGRVGRRRHGRARILWAEEDFRIAGYLASVSGGSGRAERRLATLRDYLEARESDREALARSVFL